MALRRDAKIELLKRVPLFSGCSKGELRELAKSADELDIREGTVLTREGRPGREFFVLLEGTAEVKKGSRKLNTLGPGDFFGEIALVSREPRTATVVARTPARVYRLGREGFDRLVAGAFRKGTLNPHISPDRTLRH